MDHTPGSVPETSHEDLVNAAVNGDARAISRLWEANRRWVAAVILAHKPRSADLEDLLQDVAMTLVSKVSTLRQDGNLRAWLRTVAVNASRARARSEKYRRAQSLDAGPVEQTFDRRLIASPESPGDDEENRRVMSAVEQMPDTYREPLLLRAVHGMSSRQIGEILTISEATVDTRVARARRMLREQLRDEPVASTNGRMRPLMKDGD